METYLVRMITRKCARCKEEKVRNAEFNRMFDGTFNKTCTNCIFLIRTRNEEKNMCFHGLNSEKCDDCKDGSEIDEHFKEMFRGLL